MRTKMMAIITIIIMLLMIGINIIIPVHATESTLDPNNPGGLPITNTEDAETKIEQKAWNIISLCQTIGKPICIICFIIGTIVALFGAFGRKGLAPGLIACLISGVMYVAINYAPEIVSFIQAFIVS